VLAPNAKSGKADGAQSENDESFHPNGLARKRGDEMGDESEAREHGDIDFGLGEKPEEALPEHGQSIGGEIRGLAAEETEYRKKVCASEAIGEQADGGGEEDAEN
jgi:hypothetical protein